MEVRRFAPYVAVVAALATYGLPLTPALAFFAVALCALISLTFGRAMRHFASGPAFTLLILFCAATVVSVSLSVDRPASVPAILPLISSGVLVSVLAKDFKAGDLHWLQRAFLALSLAIVLSVTWAAAVAPGATPSVWMAESDLPYLAVPNDLLILALLAPHSMALACGEDHLVVRALAVLVLGSSFGLTIIFRSRLAIATIVVGLAIVLLAMRTRMRWVAAVAAVLGFAFIGVDGVLGDFSLTTKILHGTWDTRLPLWLAAWRMFLDAPLWGQGPYAFSILGPTYLHALALPNWLVIDPRYIPWPHNLYLELLAERGVAGFGPVLALLVFALARAARGLRYAEPALRRHIAGVMGFFACFMLAGCFELSLDRYWVVTVLFINAAYIQILVNKGRE